MDNNEKKLQYPHNKINFNIDGSIITIASDKGFRIYNSSLLKLCVERQIEGGISLIEVLNNSNIMVFVGGGSNPQFPLNRLIVWDDYQMKILSEIKVITNIRNVKVKKELLYIVGESKLYILKLVNLELVDTFETCENIRGIIALSSNETSNVFAYPDKDKGHVIIRNLEKSKSISIFPHESNIAYLALNCDGNLLATASDKGTLIRIFNTNNGEFLHELRRGKERAEIYNICFNVTSKLLACSSDRKTIHIFSLSKLEKKNGQINDKNEELQRKSNVPEVPKNSKSLFHVFKKILPKYFSSEWSFAQFRLPNCKHICRFHKDSNNISIISEDCKVYEISFDPKNGGECKKEYETILNLF